MSWRESIKKIVSEIRGRHRYVHGAKGKLEKPYQNLKQLRPDDKAGKIRRIAGLGTIDLSWFLFCLGKYTAKDLNTVFIDNKIIDNFADKNKKIKVKDTDSNFKQFFQNLQKSYPQTSARLKLWMLYTLFIGLSVGGIKITKNNQDKKQIVTEFVKLDDFIESFAETETTDGKIYDLTSHDFKTDFVEENWNDIVACLLEFETFRNVPKRHSSEDRYTYGPGVTWVYIDGVQYPCSGKYKDIAANFSKYQIWDQVKQHCVYRGEVLDRMQKSLIQNGVTKISKEQALGLFVAGYQLPGTISSIVKRLKDAGEDEQKIIDSFIAGKEIKFRWRKGTNKRRWWCAMLYTGKISIYDLLQMDRDAFANIKLADIQHAGHFIYNDSVIAYAVELTNSNTETVQEYIVSNNLLDNKEDNIVLITKNKMKSFNRGIQKIKDKQGSDIINKLNNDENTMV